MVIMYEALKQQVYQANMALQKHGLVVFTWGNVSGIDRGRGVIAIKPSGVSYEKLTPDSIVIVDLQGRIVGRRAAAVVRHADAPGTLPQLSRHRRCLSHSFDVRDDVGPGLSRDPLLRHNACRPLLRAGSGDGRC